MAADSNQTFEAILKELRNITAELQRLRSDLKMLSFPKQDNSVMAAPPDATSRGNDALKEEAALAVYHWLAAKGITVKNHREQGETDAVFDHLALFLGERFQNLSRLYECIKRSLSSGGFTLNLASRSQEEIADATQFCTMLSTYAFLSSYRYQKSTKTIHASIQRIGNVINFFTGGWFERYIYLKILGVLTQNKLAFTCLINSQIMFSNNDVFELDLLFLVENQPLWVECKTGDYQGYIAKYSDKRKLLSIPKSRAFFVVLDIPADLAKNLTNLYEVTVANEGNFLEKIRTVIESPEAVQEQTLAALPAVTGANDAPHPLFTLLKKAGLRPFPAHRAQVITELVGMAGSLEHAVTITEIKHVLAEKVQTSKNQVQDILNALMRSGCLLNEEGQPISAHITPFSKLVSQDFSFLEDKCTESYVRAILSGDAGYFEHPSNVAEFEVVVGGKPPDRTMIRRLGEQSSATADDNE